jgi:hypothetical protein
VLHDVFEPLPFDPPIDHLGDVGRPLTAEVDRVRAGIERQSSPASKKSD